MKNEKILKEIEKGAGSWESHELVSVIESTESCYSALCYLSSYKEKRINKGTFDKVQFVQAVKNNIDWFLKGGMLKQYNYDLKCFTVSQRYAAAQEIAENL